MSSYLQTYLFITKFLLLNSTVIVEYTLSNSLIFVEVLFMFQCMVNFDKYLFIYGVSI